MYFRESEVEICNKPKISMECEAQVGVERSAHTSQADATRMHVTSGFCPGKGAKHNLWQEQRGQAEVKEK
jgi:hypothetical protein